MSFTAAHHEGNFCLDRDVSKHVLLQGKTIAHLERQKVTIYNDERSRMPWLLKVGNPPKGTDQVINFVHEKTQGPRAGAEGESFGGSSGPSSVLKQIGKLG